MTDNFKLESPGPECKRWSWGKYSTKTKLHSKQEGWVSIVEIFEQELALVGGRCTWTKTTLTRATLTRDTWLGAHWPGPGVPRPGTPIKGTPGLGTHQEVHWDHVPHGVGALGFDKAARRQKGPRRLLGSFSLLLLLTSSSTSSYSTTTTLTSDCPRCSSTSRPSAWTRPGRPGQ